MHKFALTRWRMLGTVALLLLTLTVSVLPASAQYPYGYYGGTYPYGSYYSGYYGSQYSYYGGYFDPYGFYYGGYGSYYSPYTSYYGYYSPYGYGYIDPYSMYYGGYGYNPYSLYGGYGYSPYSYNSSQYTFGYYYPYTSGLYGGFGYGFGCGAYAGNQVGIYDGPPGYYQPATISVRVGDTVTWTNCGPMNQHTTTSTAGLWDSGALSPGQSFSYRFTTAGTFTYRCTLHGHNGTVIVS